jgi:hypothetical protein
MDRRHSKTKCPLYAFRIVHANNQTLEIVVEAKCRQQTKFLDEPSAVSRQPSAELCFLKGHQLEGRRRLALGQSAQQSSGSPLLYFLAERDMGDGGAF